MSTGEETKFITNQKIIQAYGACLHDVSGMLLPWALLLIRYGGTKLWYYGLLNLLGLLRGVDLKGIGFQGGFIQKGESVSIVPWDTLAHPEGGAWAKGKGWCHHTLHGPGGLRGGLGHGLVHGPTTS